MVHLAECEIDATVRVIGVVHGVIRGDPDVEPRQLGVQIKDIVCAPGEAARAQHVGEG